MTDLALQDPNGRIELFFPTPAHPVSENAIKGKHWAVRVRLLQPWREAAAWAVIQARSAGLAKRLPPCSFQLRLAWPGARRVDPANMMATSKAVLDELVLKGVWPSDKPEWITVLEPECVKTGLSAIILRPRVDG